MYCVNNPIRYSDPCGYSVILAIFGVLAIVTTTSAATGAIVNSTINTPSNGESTITAADLNINNSTGEGKINVKINEHGIEIVDSYLYTSQEDRIRILELIMESEEYKEFAEQYGTGRTLKDYLKEWNAHNVIWGLATSFNFFGIFNGEIEHTESVFLNWDLSEDDYSWAYKYF